MPNGGTHLVPAHFENEARDLREKLKLWRGLLVRSVNLLERAEVKGPLLTPLIEEINAELDK